LRKQLVAIGARRESVCEPASDRSLALGGGGAERLGLAPGRLVADTPRRLPP
jgi:hypothetical protein